MTRSTTDITAALDSLRASDFDFMQSDADGINRLQDLCQEIKAFAVCDAAPLLLGLLERLDGSDLGSPGPIVHTLESMNGYEPFLAESLSRKPTALSVWMANRILNARRPDRVEWLARLKCVASSPTASLEVKAEALEFLEFQNEA
jgi:hypothetical protein